MKKAELKVYREQLLALRSRLRGDVNAMANAALNKTRSETNGDLSSMPIHMADLGSDNFEQEFTLSLMQTEGGTLESIEAALEKIEDGVFGLCEECSLVISKTRLNAIPYAPCASNALKSSNRAEPRRMIPSATRIGLCREPLTARFVRWFPYGSPGLKPVP